MKTKLTAHVFKSNIVLLGLLSVCCLIFFSISSCKKNKGTSGPPVDLTAPIVNSISPLKGPGLTELTIEGSNFSAVLSENKITINGKEALVVDATATKLIVLVPMGAGTGPVKVQVGTKTGTGPNFEYEWVLVVNTLAGDIDEPGFADGTGNNARFSTPSGMVLTGGADGSLYVLDQSNFRIRKITSEGVVTTFAGSTEGHVDGNVSAAKFYYPFSIAAGSGGVLYVGEYGSIRKITADGTVSTFVGGGPNNAGILDGQGTAAKVNSPVGLVVDAQGNLYCIDGGFNAGTSLYIRKITPAGVISTLAGGGSYVGPDIGLFDYQDGQGTAARFSTNTNKMTIDAQGNLFVGDFQNNCIRKVTPDGMVSTYAGVKGENMITNGSLTSARFFFPTTLTIDSKGNMYVADRGCIRKINTVGTVSTYAGSGIANVHSDGPVMTAGIANSISMAFSPDESILYFGEANYGAQGGHTIRRVMLQ